MTIKEKIDKLNSRWEFLNNISTERHHRLRYALRVERMIREANNLMNWIQSMESTVFM